MMASFFSFDDGRCPLCLTSSHIKNDYANCNTCGTIFSKFSILFPNQMETEENIVFSDQEMC